MSKGSAKAIARGIKLGFSEAHARLLAKLDTPEKIQDYLNKMPINHEVGGETCLTAAGALRLGAAHCIEAAMIAAAAFWMQGCPPLLLDFQSAGNDDDHVVAIFKQAGCWGAISKSNHAVLRWRDPVYRTLRELAMSYFHEYTSGTKKTLRTYSRPFDLRRYEPQAWASGEECWDLALDLDNSRHYRLITRKQEKLLMPRTKFEQRLDDLIEYPEKKRKR